MLKAFAIALTFSAGITVAQGFGFSDDLRPTVEEAAAAIAAEAKVAPETLRDVRCTRRPSRVFGDVYACRATIDGAQWGLVLTNFDGRWTVAGR